MGEVLKEIRYIKAITKLTHDSLVYVKNILE